MASWFDLKGTFQNTFRIGGKAKTKLDASAPTVSRDFLLPDASVDMTGGTVGQVLSKLTATTIGWANAGGGGGGYTEIANNGTISGSYDGNVHCLGNVTITGDLTVKGSIYVVGKTTNLVGADVTVYGDCTFAGEVDFQTNTGVTAGNIDIKGNFYTGTNTQAYEYPISNAGFADVSNMNGIGFSSVVSFLSNNFFSVSGDFISMFPFLTNGKHITFTFGPNAGETRTITSLFFNGSETEITTAPFTNNLDGFEQGYLASREAAIISAVNETDKFNIGGYHKFTSGANSGALFETSSVNFSVNTEITFLNPITNPWDGTIANASTGIKKAFRINRVLTGFARTFSLIPFGSKLKFSSSSNNPSSIVTTETANASAITKDVFINGVYAYSQVVFPIELSNAILNTDKYFHLDDMGMLFTWDIGPSPTINIGKNYACLGGMKAFPRSGNISGATMFVGENIIAQKTFNDIYSNGSLIDLKGSGLSSGGSIEVLGGVYKCSINTKADLISNLTGSSSGNGGNIKIGNFIGELYVNKKNGGGGSPCSGSYLDSSAGLILTGSNNVGGNAGNITCLGDFIGNSIQCYGGSELAFLNLWEGTTNVGGNAGDLIINGNVEAYSSIICMAGAGNVVGLAGKININGRNLITNYFNCSLGFTNYTSSGIEEAFSGPNALYNTFTNLPNCYLSAVNIVGIEMYSPIQNYGALIQNRCSVDNFGRTFECNSLSHIEYRGNSKKNITARDAAKILVLDKISDCTISNFGFNGANGGSCTTIQAINSSIVLRADQLGFGGSGGSFNADLADSCSISTNGGNNSGGAGGSGGSITVDVAINCSFSSNGGNSSTLNQNGGNGGNVTCAEFSGSVIQTYGGNSGGGTGLGGTAGNVTITKNCTATTVLANGGNGTGTGRTGANIYVGGKLICDGDVSISGGNGTVAGSCGNFRVGGGCEIRQLLAIDGTGTASALTRNIEFNGYCVLNAWNIQNRTTVRIRSRTALTTAPNAVLFCASRTGKTVLTKSGGTETASSTQAMFYNGTDWNNFTSTVQA